MLAVAAGGLVRALGQPAVYVSRSEILLPPLGVDSKGKALRNTTTEVHIVRSTEVLSVAGQDVTPPISAAKLRPHIGVKSVSTDLVEVRASAGSPGRATKLADAVAKQYVAFSNGVTSDQTDATAAALKTRAADLEKQGPDLDAQINSNVAQLATMDPKSPEALRLSALIDGLRASSVDVARQLLSINAQISDARLTTALGRNGTRVLESATKPGSPASPRPVRDALAAAFLGLLAGAILALALDGRDRRLRTRDQIAEAAAAPVLASLEIPRRTGVSDYAALLGDWEPEVRHGLALRQMLAAVGTAGGDPVSNVVVVTLAGDSAGPPVACQLAAFSAMMGDTTTLVVAAQHASTDQLRTAFTNINSGGTPARPNLYLTDGPVRDANGLGPDLTITVMVAEGRDVEVPQWTEPTSVLLAVSCGFVTADDLASVAVSFLDAGYPLLGVVVANPDPSDSSTGRHMPAWPAASRSPEKPRQARRKVSSRDR
ncbi:MAG: hypothetical protein QOG43_2208 [Actinomycetota bacterium]|nr:hypothetical protein [Actinomycetota bacterium]